MFEPILKSAVEFWLLLAAMSPYLLLGLFVTGLLSVLIPPETVERQLGGRGMWSSVKASLFGVPLPLCSCGVIPVAASLRKHGASRGATAAFLLSTPQTGADSILVTLSLLGPVFAIFRPVAAFVTGVVGGVLVESFGSGSEADSGTVEKCTDLCCTGGEGHSKLSRALLYAFVTLPRDIGKPLIIGLLIAAVISVVVPQDYFAGVLGHGIVGMIVMMLVGIPVYVCATASVPVAAALIATGVSPGAALVFLMTGPATNAATISVIWKTVGRRTAFIYLAVVGVGALLCGLGLDYIIKTYTPSAVAPLPWMLPGFVKAGSAVALLVILAAALLHGGHAYHEHDEVASHEAGSHEAASDGAASRHDKTLLSIKGMTCSHCAESVRRALTECQGVESAEVDLGSGLATVSGHDCDPRALTRAVEALGYNVEIHREEQHV